MKETYFGYIKDVRDVQLLVKAAQLGKVNLLETKLDTKERGDIRSGSVFIWSEIKTNLKRWRDGKCWSASRFQGKFLVYKELYKLGNNSFYTPTYTYSETPETNTLFKKTITVSSRKGDKYRVVNYYCPYDIMLDKLISPSSDPFLRTILDSGTLDEVFITEEHASEKHKVNEQTGSTNTSSSLKTPSSSKEHLHPITHLNPSFKRKTNKEHKKSICLPPMTNFLSKPDSDFIDDYCESNYALNSNTSIFQPVMAKNAEDKRQISLLDKLY